MLKLIFCLSFSLSVAVIQAQNHQGVQQLTPQVPLIVDDLLPDFCSYPRQEGAEITHLVMHFCSDAVINPENPYQLHRIREIFTEFKVSAHYLIDRQGNIYRLVPEARAAKHVSYGQLPNPPYHRDKLNHYAIGIELMGIGTTAEMMPFQIYQAHYNRIAPEHIGFTAAQYQSLVGLF
nr:N-acetylmuramoyl-L-alanine amidase [Microscillaceae bacterium]